MFKGIRWFVGQFPAFIPIPFLWVGGALAFLTDHWMIGMVCMGMCIGLAIGTLGYTVFDNVRESRRQRRNPIKAGSWKPHSKPLGYYEAQEKQMIESFGPHITGCEMCGTEHPNLRQAYAWHLQRRYWILGQRAVNIYGQTPAYWDKREREYLEHISYGVSEIDRRVIETDVRMQNMFIGWKP